MSSYTQKNVVDAFGLVSVFTSLCDAFLLVLTPLRWFLGSFAFSPFNYVSCSSSLIRAAPQAE